MLHCKIIFNGRWDQLNFTKTSIRNGVYIPLYFEMCVEIYLFYLWYVFETVSELVLCHCLTHFIQHTFWKKLAYVTILDIPIGWVPIRGVAEVECIFSQHQSCSLCFMVCQHFLTVVSLWPFSPSCLCSRQVVGIIGDRYS